MQLGPVIGYRLILNNTMRFNDKIYTVELLMYELSLRLHRSLGSITCDSCYLAIPSQALW